MNKIYRLKFSKRLNALVAVSELTRGCDHSTEKGSEKPARMKVRHLALKPLSAILLSLGVTSIPQSVLASGLQGMDVVHGTATMQVDGNKTIIRNSVDAIINWKQFNIDQNEMVQFLQESNNSAVFNRVTSNQISQLKGILDSNGQVFLINPNGITIGKDAIINTNGFTASTLDISNENIKARNFTLEQTKDKALAEIVNHGLITVGKDGSVNLIGGKVKNEGVISVNGGSISLLAGQKITISDIANPTITYSIAAPGNEAINLGDIFAKSGNINVRAATIRNKGKLSADSVSKDKSGNIVLSAKEGEAEIGGVISAQNQQAKGGKLMITGDKVTLKTGAVIDLSGKEGGETYLGGDERGEGKNGIQLAKKTTLEKGSTINVSGKEKGGRAIVWGDIALINGDINAQGSDIAKTGGFVETSGHDLSIGDNAIVDAKEWLLDPDIVSIDSALPGRSGNTSEDDEYMTGIGTKESPKRNHTHKTTLTNSTLEAILQKGSFVNITATKKIYVNSSINLGNGDLTLYSMQDGITINKDISAPKNGNANLTIKAGTWLDIHSNISVGDNGVIDIVAKDTIAIENKSNMITFLGRGNIIAGRNKGFKFENVSLEGKGRGLNFKAHENSNMSSSFKGVLNISGNVKVERKASTSTSIFQKGGLTHWNVTQVNLKEDSTFEFYSKTDGKAVSTLPKQGAGGIRFNADTVFNIPKSSKVNFTFIYPIIQVNSGEFASINGNLTVQGGGGVNMKFSSYDNSYYTIGIGINSRYINVSNGSFLNIKGDMPAKKIFTINNDLTINATDSSVSITEVEGIDTKLEYGLFARGNITVRGGNVTLGSNKAKTRFEKNIVVDNASLTLSSANFNTHKGSLVANGNISVTGKSELIASGDTVEITGDLDIAQSAKFKGSTNNNLNITGTFTNNGTSVIDVKKGAARFGDIINENSLSVTTNAQNNQKTIITGNITNKKGDLNITDNKANAEIQIGGNISQKEGNLTISSDKVNITNRITIKAGVDEESSGSSSSTKSNANLTIKTKTLELTNDLNISGFNKAEITAKNDSNLTIGKASGGDGDAKKVTFDKVKDSKISANGRKVILNSKVETSNGDSNTEDSSNDNNAGLIITAKDVAVNNNITSHKTVNISAAEGGIDTKAGTTINAIAGSVEITAKTGKINGEVKSASGNVNITASGDTLNVSNISGNTVTITADNSKLTTTEGSIINATESAVNISVKEGDLKGAVEAKKNSVNITAKESNLTVSNVTAKNNVTVKAEKGTLTTVAESKITSTDNAVTVITQNGGTINGNIEAEKGLATVTASTGDLSVANVTGKTAILTATQGKLTSTAGSTINGTDSVTTSSQSGDISGTISGNMVSVKATGDLTTQSGSKIEAKSGEANVTSETG
ncbi:TPA: filamentous hemagglutinin N-terminal domain-containing protein, partial [Haemophilus influenzae]